MKVKKEYLILGAAIAGLVSYLVFHQTDRTRYRLPDLPGIQDGRISKIHMDRAEGVVDIVKTDDKWVIGKESYPADAETIREMLDAIQSLSVTALVSESKNYSRYQLEPGEKITVRAWAGDTLNREFEIGKPAPTYQHTFIKLAGDPNVYHARGDLRSRFEKSIDEMRDRTVLSFTLSEIQEAELGRGNAGVICRKEESVNETDDAKGPAGKGNKSEGWITSTGEPVNPERVNRLLADLSDLECEGFAVNSRKEDLQDPILSIALKGNKEYTLTVYPKKENEAKGFPAVSSQSPYVFILPESRVESLETAFDEILEAGGKDSTP